MDKKVPLSNLIEIGCRKTVPIEGGFSDIVEWGSEPYVTIKACAFGAAGLALRGEVSDKLDPAFSWTRGVEVIHPVNGIRWDLFNVIVNLNDHYKWPREHIAFWLRSIGY